MHGPQQPPQHQRPTATADATTFTCGQGRTTRLAQSAAHSRRVSRQRPRAKACKGTEGLRRRGCAGLARRGCEEMAMRGADLDSEGALGVIGTADGLLSVCGKSVHGE